MASLSKRSGKYLSKISITSNGTRKTIYVPLDTSNKSKARRRNKSVTFEEQEIKRAIRENCATKSELLNINDTIDWKWKKVNGQGNTYKLKTIKVAVSRFLEHLSVRSTRQSTINTYGYALELFASCTNVEVDDIRTEHIDKYMGVLKARDRIKSDVTINSYLKSVRVFLNWCVKRDMLEILPEFSFVNSVKEDKWLTEKEYNAILNYEHYTSDRFRKAFKMYAETGLRLAEAFNGQIIEDNLGIWLVVARDNNKGKKPKIIRINDEHKSTIELMQSLWNENGRTESSMKYYSRVFAKARNKIGIAKHKSLHSLRHYFGKTELIKRGNIYEVSGLLGHHDISITQESYVRDYDERQNLLDFPSLFKGEKEAKNINGTLDKGHLGIQHTYIN